MIDDNTITLQSDIQSRCLFRKLGSTAMKAIYLASFRFNPKEELILNQVHFKEVYLTADGSTFLVLEFDLKWHEIKILLGKTVKS